MHVLPSRSCPHFSSTCLYVCTRVRRSPYTSRAWWLSLDLKLSQAVNFTLFRIHVCKEDGCHKTDYVLIWIKLVQGCSLKPWFQDSKCDVVHFISTWTTCVRWTRNSSGPHSPLFLLLAFHESSPTLFQKYYQTHIFPTRTEVFTGMCSARRWVGK